jgi:hypothetical protein
MKGANGFRFCGFQVKKRLMASFCFGKGEVMVSDVGCTMEIKNVGFFLAKKKKSGCEDGNGWPCMV